MMLQRLDQLETILFIQSLSVVGNPLLYASEGGPISSVPEPEFRQFNYNELPTGNKLTANQAQLGHMFNNDTGHFVNNTAANRAAIEHAAGYNKYYLGSDQYGNVWYAETLPNGTQVWAEVRNGVIVEGGLNLTPKTYNPTTGLKAITR